MSLASLVINLVARTENLEQGFGRANNEITKLQHTARMFGGDLGRVIGSASRVGGIGAALYLVNRSMNEVAMNSEKFKGLMTDTEINRIKEYASWWQDVKLSITAAAAYYGQLLVALVNPTSGITAGMPSIDWANIDKNRAKTGQLAEGAMAAVDPAYAAKKQYDSQVKLFKWMRDNNKFAAGDFEMWAAKAKARYDKSIAPSKTESVEMSKEELEFTSKYASTMERVNQLREQFTDQLKLDAGISRELLAIEKAQIYVEENFKGAYRDELLNRLRVTEELQRQYDLENKKADKTKDAKDAIDEQRISSSMDTFGQLSKDMSISGLKIGSDSTMTILNRIAKAVESTDRKTVPDVVTK